ncbi:NAD(P)/FAD-dependent oxidoreductase [Geminicoccus harenae]|uniref:NAD(P)/FAD-dependent oxidoreductase n=1 Tax=Geminicoccus harenae TaxID=2498453 RepID=UPI00168A8609|nr:FAD-binding oxidoreductase [Geminicoccus harenae]
MQRSPIEPSLWYATAPAAPPTEPIDGEVTADVCVIGAGYTGLSTALHLAEQGVRVVVLEAKEVGFGCSGRNAGHCTPTFHFYSIPTVRKMLGPVYGERLVERQTNGANLAFDIIRRYGIDCEAVQNGYLMVAHAPSRVKVLEEKQRTYASAGKVTHLLDKAETERLTGSPRYYGAWLHPEGGHLNPLAYARGLAGAVISQGGTVHTRSPVTGIEPAGTRWRVVTPTGAVTADKVVCGTGAYTDDYWPGLNKTFTTMPVMILATQPLSDNVRKTIAPENHTVVETRDDPMIYKYNKEGRLVTSVFVEGKRGGDLEYTKKLTADKLKWMLPQLDEVDFEYAWTGDLDMQPKTFPRLFELAPGVVASLGYSGRGVPTGTMMGTVLSEWAMGMPKEDLTLPLEPMTASPFWMKFVPYLFLSATRARDQWVAKREGVNPPAY